MIAAVLVVMGASTALFILLRTGKFADKLENWADKISPALLSGASKLMLILLLGLGFLYAQYLHESTPAFKQRIMPVFLLAVLMIGQSLVLVCRLNRHLHHKTWFESCFVFPRITTLLDKFDSRADRLLTAVSGKLSRSFLVALLLIWPLAFNLAVSWVFFGTTLTEFTIETSDEVKYWLEAAAFKTAGFSGGQFGNDHLVARADFAHFSSRGPYYAVLQGSIGKLIGWQNYTPVLTNLFFLLAALIVYLYLLKPDKKQLFTTWLVMATFTPLYIYIPSAMVQVMHQGLALVIAALFIRWVRSGPDRDRHLLTGLVMVIFAAALFRYSWMVLYLPVLVVAVTKYKKKGILLLLGAITVLSSVTLASALYILAPYPMDIRFQILGALQENLGDGILLIFENAAGNLGNLFEREGIWIQVFHAQFGVLIISAIGYLISLLDARRRTGDHTNDKLRLIHSLNILAIFVVNISLYYVRSSNDYRVWAPHLLLSLVVLLHARPRREFWIVLFLGLFVLLDPGNLLPNFDFANGTDPAIAFQGTAAFTKEIEGHLEFVPGQNKWCNTVEISKYGLDDPNYRPKLLGLPPGFGYMTTVDWQNTQPEDVQAKYLIFNPEYLENEAPGLLKALDLTQLAETSLGNLYLNHNSACPN